jgi:N6-adenosine-specific RNA methylase IME4
VKYRTIVVDPPWEYARTGVTFHEAEGGQFTGHGLPYSTMSVEEIARLPVLDLSDASGCHLYLWTTQRYLPGAFHIAAGWGFTYSSTLVWCKAARGWNVGGTFPSTTEFVIFARRGQLPALHRADRQWWEWPRGEHSAKPEAFMDLVEQVSPGPRLEMFARRQRLGWDTWGNEALEHVTLENTKPAS